MRGGDGGGAGEGVGKEIGLPFQRWRPPSRERNSRHNVT